MLPIITGTFRLLLRRWPVLVALFLAGWILRFLLIRIAGAVAQIDPLLGTLILPLAVLARLATYVAMFLVLREEMPAFQRMTRRQIDPEQSGRRFADVVSSSILGFFIIFATWDMLEDDKIDYASSVLDQADWFGRTSHTPVLELELTPVTISIIIIAFVLKFLIRRFSHRLPVWSNYLAVYLEAVWIFVAVVVFKTMFEAISGWVMSRNIVAWGLDVVETTRHIFTPFGWLVDAVGWVVSQTGIVLVLPLAWLTLAGIVYSKALSLSRGVTAPAATPKRLERVKERYERVPGFLRSRASELADDFISRWRPISDSARLIWTAGALAMTFFVLAYAVLDTSTLWLNMGFYRLIGPHELAFWFAADNNISLVVDAIVEPLRICLIAATYDFCLRRLDESQSLKSASVSPGPGSETEVQKDSGSAEVADEQPSIR